MNPKVLVGKLRRNATPQTILSILFIAALIYLVLVPLIIMVQETFIVHPMERFQIPGSLPGDFTLSHWKRTFVDSSSYSFFYKPLLNTLIISTSLAVLSLLIGGALAWLVVRTDLPYKKFISNIAIVPYIMPSWAMSLAWITLFKNQRIGGSMGLFQYLTGISPPNWFSYGMFPIIVTLSLHYFPFGFMLIANALRNIDSQLEESAQLLGATRWQTLRRVVFPIVTPVIFSTFLLTFSRGLGTFGTPSFLGGPVRTYVLSTMLHANLVGQRPGIGYLVAFVMILMGVLILFMDHKLLGARKSFVTISGKSGKSELTKLGKLRWPITVVVVAFLLCVTVVPFVVLAIDSMMLIPGEYSLKNLSLHYWIGPASQTIGLGTSEPGILRNPAILGALGNSLKLGVITALICGVAGLLIGYTVVRTRGTFFSKFLDQLAFLPYLMPSIAFGSIFLALFAVRRGPIPSLYGTFTLLVIACSVKYLPFASRAGISAMMQIGPELEEAATMVGAPWRTRIQKIILPLQKSSFFSGLLLPFISAMRELSLVVLLVTPGTQVATAITLRYTDRGWYPYTNAVMVLIVAAVLITTAISRKLMGTDLAKGIGG
ncbi:MAG: iron ABC transporter permease [Firmicutes bacterium]|mgnify:CR=1 FL=1|nr:iron ABC transporter permease [Bacillota bacterium]